MPESATMFFKDLVKTTAKYNSMILFRMSKEPIRQTYPAVAQLPQYAGYNQPVINSPAMQHYGGYHAAQYLPEVTMHPAQAAVVADGMVSVLFCIKLWFVSELP